MRHGTCDDGLCRPEAHARPGSPLTVLGEAEVALTARRLAESGRRPALILGSPLRRAVSSVRVLLEVLGECPCLAPDPLFAEWAAPDCVRGQNPRQYPAEYLEWQQIREADPRSALPGGESLAALQARAVSARHRAHELAARHGHVLVVSHRVFVGSVSAVAARVTDPVVAFRLARDFRLPAAATWADPAGHA